MLVFYNDAAGGCWAGASRRSGSWRPSSGARRSAPSTTRASRSTRELPLTIALRGGRPAHARFRIRALEGAEHEIEVSAMPIDAAEGSAARWSFFWPDGDEEA